ncbi:MAG: response regulator [Myxococcota bacterium]
MLILVVEDDEANRHLLTRALEAQGYVVEARGSAFGLVNRMAGRTGERVPDALVLDHGLPGLSGQGVLELLAKDPVARNIPVVLYSAVDLGSLQSYAAVHPRCVAIQKSGHVREVVMELRRALGAPAVALARTDV